MGQDYKRGPGEAEPPQTPASVITYPTLSIREPWASLTMKRADIQIIVEAAEEYCRRIKEDLDAVKTLVRQIEIECDLKEFAANSNFRTLGGGEDAGVRGSSRPPRD